MERNPRKSYWIEHWDPVDFDEDGNRIDTTKYYVPGTYYVGVFDDMYVE